MKAIASYSKNGTAYLPKIIGEDFKAVVKPRASFLGYTTKQAAINQAQNDIDGNWFLGDESYRITFKRKEG